jgi:hypothetical protein
VNQLFQTFSEKCFGINIRIVDAEAKSATNSEERTLKDCPGLIQFIEALPSAPAGVTSCERWHVSGDDAYDKKFLNSLRIICVGNDQGRYSGETDLRC